MFKSLKRVTYYVDDLSKAKEWYCGVLQREPLFDSPFNVLFNVGDTSLSLVPQSGDMSSSVSGGAYWEVEDTASSLTSLIDLGAREHTAVKRVMNIDMAKVVDPFGNVLGITSSSSTKERVVEKQASGTAMFVTFCRALAYLDERKEIKGSDEFASLFLTEQFSAPLKSAEARKWSKDKISDLYGYTVARTAYVDHLFCSAVLEETPQIVLLGAGYDMRSYRYGNLIKNSKVFEVDTEVAQQRKLKILTEHKMDTPKGLKRVNINFKTDDLGEVLSQSGYDKLKKTMFIWEGVTPYLSREHVERTLTFFTKEAALGSTIFFDYLTEERSSNYDAEPFKFWISKEEMNRMLSRFGLTVLKTVEKSEMEQRFLSLSDGTVGESSVPYFSFIQCRSE